MKLFRLILLFLISLPSIGISSDQPSAAEGKTVVYDVKQVCEYDEYCRYAFDDNGKPYPIKPEVRFVVANLHKQIVAAGEKYGVDPRAIAGAILAENTMNVQFDDEIQNFLASNGVTSVAGKSFSYGLGQLKEERAMAGEKVIAAIEGRAPRDWREVSRAMLEPIETVNLIAGVIREGQDLYKAKGHDISSRPDILTTLYNLGRVDEKAAQLNESSTPRANYFGAFVANNIKDVEDVIGWSPKGGKYQSKYLNHSSFDLSFRGKPIDVFSRPPTCTSHQTTLKVADINRDRTYKEFRRVGRLRGHFQIIAEQIDCDMKRWVLVSEENGATGWVNHAELESGASSREKTSRQKAHFTRMCKKNRADCLKRIPGVTGTETSEDSPGLVDVTVNTHEGVDEPSIKNFSSECLHNQVQTNTSSSARRSGRERVRMNGIFLRNFSKDLEEKKLEVMKTLGVDKYEDLPRSLRDAFDSLESRVRDAQRLLSRGGIYLGLQKSIDRILSWSPPATPSGTPATSATPTTPQVVHFGNAGPKQGGALAPTNSGRSSRFTRQQRRSFDDFYYMTSDFVYDRDHVQEVRAASNPDYVDKRQPLGPASAPRGEHAREMSREAEQKRRYLKDWGESFSACEKYPEAGINRANYLKYASNQDINSYVSRNLNDMKNICQLYDAIESGDDSLGSQSGCSYNDTCYIQYFDDKGRLQGDYFPVDYIKKHAGLLNPGKVMKQMSDKVRKDVDDYIANNSRRGSRSSNNQPSQDYTRQCAYDPETTNMKIAQLSKLSCVAAVFVPDSALFFRQERQGTEKVVFSTSDSDTSYQVKIKGCEVEAYEGANAATEEATEENSEQ